jgi:hypothetical protein
MVAMMNQQKQGNQNTATSNTINDRMDRPLAQTNHPSPPRISFKTHPRETEAQTVQYAETRDEQQYHRELRGGHAHRQQAKKQPGDHAQLQKN